MALANVEAVRWNDAHDRLAQLELEHQSMMRRALLAIGLNVLLLATLIGGIAWSGESLRVKTLTAGTVNADTVATTNADLTADGLRIENDEGSGSLTVSLTSPAGPTLWLQHDQHGQVVVSTERTPFIGLYASGKDDATQHQPQIELSLADDQSPRIILRDVRGRVVWQAP